MINRQTYAFAIAKMTLSFQKTLQICAFDRKFQPKNKPRQKSVSGPHLGGGQKGAATPQTKISPI